MYTFTTQRYTILEYISIYKQLIVTNAYTSVPKCASNLNLTEKRLTKKCENKVSLFNCKTKRTSCKQLRISCLD